MNDHYPIVIHKLKKYQGGGYYVYLPDFGHSSCSATGDTISEALESLENVKVCIIDYFKKHNVRILMCSIQL